MIYLKYIPYIYKKTIFDIPYDKLKKENIKCLIFDLDNTLALIDERECPLKTMKLIEKLKKECLDAGFYIDMARGDYKNWRRK
mgnify:CR=1 FL=1